MNWGQRLGLAAVLAMFALGGCGSDDAFVGPPGGGGGGDGGGDPGDPVVPVVNSILLLVDPPVLASAAIGNDAGVTVTAIARDANNVVIPETSLTFSADSGALAVADPITDANGRARAILTTGGDPRNRTITVSAASGTITTSITIDVVGTQLLVAGPPSIESGETETFTVTLRDSSGVGLRDVTVDATSANGNVITPASAVTNVDGVTTFQVSGNAGGADTLTFTGMEMSTARPVLVSPYGFVFIQPAEGAEVNLGDVVTVEVELRQDGNPLDGETVQFSATRGTLSANSQVTAGGGRATVTLTSAGANGAGPVLVTALGPDNVQRKHLFEFVATTPTTISTQVEPGTVAPGGQASVITVVRDANSNPVKNQVVRFALEDVSGGSLTASTDVTDTQGIARTTYVASTASSAQNGVRVIAEVGDPVIASDDAFITVAAPTLFIVLGTDNLVVKNNADATYDKTFNALILDSAGNPPPPGTQFRLSLRSLEYQKGFFSRAAPTDPWVIDPGDLVPGTDPFFGGMGPYFGEGPYGCRTEDPQGTGNINLSTDYNNNGQIDPANVALVPSTAEISTDGVASFTIRWPQNYALWALVRLTATAVVAGTESTRRLDFVLPMLAADSAANTTPPNLVSPWGIQGDCTNPS
ncbi:MAG: Ig-like domain-containing protein [Xanthomonadaceae bacterium]|nr:Ig-like domain-containing protein [Xanthomonadaceae bacterium]